MVNSFHLYYTYYNIMHTLLKARNKQRKSLNILKGINCKELMNLFFFCFFEPHSSFYSSIQAIVLEQIGGKADTVGTDSMATALPRGKK